MKRSSLVASAIVVAFAFATPHVAAQGQPGQPPAGQPPAGQPPAGQPGAQPGAQPGQQPGAQPRPRPRPRPQGQPGQPLPNNHPPIQGQQPKPKPAADPHAGGHDDHGSHDCHGPNAPPHHINWYQGLLGVNNKKAESGRFVDKLLWRYHNPKDECDPKNQEPPFLAQLINLGIVIFVIVRFGRKPITEALAKRKKTIMQDIDAATELRVDAEKRLKGYEKQLARIEDRRVELQEEYRAAWEAERARILKEAEEKAQRLRRDADFRVAQELKQAQSDVLREAVDEAVLAAEEVLRSRIAAADQERLADEYLTGVAQALKPAAAGRRTT